MQQKENISEVLIRYVLDECNQEEIDRIISYFKNSTNSDGLPSVVFVLDLLRQNQGLESSFSDLDFKQVLKVAKKEELASCARRGFPYDWRGYASIAAMLIGVLITSIFFWQNQMMDKEIIIPSDAITLELENGRLEVLKDDGSTEVVDKSGKILGQQKGQQLSYVNDGTVDDLVFNTLTVPNGKRFELELSDGSIAHLNAGTSLKYPVRFIEGQKRTVFLTGEAFFKVSKDSLHPFIVNADNLDVQVLGTQFNVASYPEDNTTDVVLVEGSVGMNEKSKSFNTETSTILKPGFMGSFIKEDGKIETQEVVTDSYISWMNGSLVFRNMTFDNILRKMERHYNVSITNNNTRLGQEVFNASYGEISIIRLLEDLKLMHGIDYTLNQSNITIKNN